MAWRTGRRSRGRPRGPTHGDAAAHGNKGAKDANRRVDEGVRKARRGVDERREEHRLEALLPKGGVGLGEARGDLLLHLKGLHGGDAADHLLNVCRELAADARLAREVLGAVRGDEARGEDGDGSEQRHHGGDGGVEGKHEGERHHDGEDTGRKLLEGHEEAVGEHVGVRDDAARQVAVAVRVKIGEGQLLQVVKAAASQVERGPKGEAVGHRRERPLADGSGAENCSYPGKRLVEATKVDLAGTHHAVDRLAGEHGKRERAHDDGYGEQRRQRQGPTARGEEPGHAAHRSVRGASSCVLLAHRDTSSAVSWDSQISR